jgi:hypothetical protein
MGQAQASGHGLSAAQASFAREHDARPGMHADDDDRMVFLYRNSPWATYRWLVDDAGRLVDATAFHRSPIGRPGTALAA